MVAPSSRNWTDLIRQCAAIVGEDGVISSAEERSVYECDGLASYRQMPGLVVLPRTTEQVAALVQLCDRELIPFVARGSGTGLSGGALPTPDCMLIVTARMNQILEVDLENQRVRVQPGVINAWVTQAVADAGYYYAPDPSSQIICSIGGNIAENSGGVHCLKYGVTNNHVLSMTFVLPNGAVMETGRKVPELPGYDLTGLLVGSEGTLGIATEITLRILKAPEAVEVLLADFTTIEAAGQTVADIIQAGIIPAGMEIMDNLSINAVEDVVQTNCYPRDAGAVLIIELDGLQEEVVASRQRVGAICDQNGARQVTVATDLQERLRLWKGRKAAFAAAGKLSPNYFVQDGVIPRTKLATVLGEIEALGQQFGYQIANVFHAGDGNLHPLILYDESVPGSLQAVEALGGEILKLCVRSGGSISGEHGIGSDKKCFMPDMFSALDLESMLWVRQAFDPKTLANPEKVFPTPRTCGEGAHAHLSVEVGDAQLF
ncbi:FAD-linked oxidase C-terminal domain-containing protein [Lyngbya confervoides]|uniref:FAD-binding protein n=1 Tax=Lyngbya confervoides BDU141951 TaxID=1574623 RepID=A0ABD4T7L4_9CYAN|nr:FAD-linked oxidase C-terminal domain-containing protein [Lyngbya confervoides]MCM1984509.1 FAD-binding protein [Lyngbya confervoides BDU141951]